MNVKKLELAFERRGVTVAVDKLLPLKTVECDPKKSLTFRRILKSVTELGVIEPLIIFPAKGQRGVYIVLDGHFRLQAVKRLEYKTVFCLIATEDEAYTYNHKVNKVTPIQEHFMIMRALDLGLSEERIAASLDVDAIRIRQKRDLLNGICPEAVELLKEKHASPEAMRQMRKVKPMRQLAMAELMIATNTFTGAYAKCIFAGTPRDQLLEPEKPKEVRGLKPEDMAKMEKEMEMLTKDFCMIEQAHGRNVLNLVLSVAYLRKLMDNAAVLRCLSQKHADILAEFQKLIDSASLESPK